MLPRCPKCSAFGSFVWVRVIPGVAPAETETPAAETKAVHWTDAAADQPDRFSSGKTGFDHVLGGGIPETAMILMAGEPGCGKSTLTAEAAGFVAMADDVLYVTAEEVQGQVGARFERVGVKKNAKLHLLVSAQVEDALEAIEAHRPRLVIIDSIQTMRVGGLDGGAGTLAHLTEAARKLNAAAHAPGSDMAIILICHVTKDGDIAGPKSFDHLVDIVLLFEGDRGAGIRMVRTLKNRFGAAGDLGLFEMTATGLKDLKDASSVFLSGRQEYVPGSVVTVSAEASSQPLLLEIQSLVHPLVGNVPKRSGRGIDGSRVSDIAMVLCRMTDMDFTEKDLRTQVMGGAETRDVGTDLAIAISLASSYRHLALPPDVVVVGEIGLAGDVRPATRMETRVAEAFRFGFRKVVAAKGAIRSADLPKGMAQITVSRVDEVSAVIEAIGVNPGKRAATKRR
jgi:DNA repair protein RadA/Sms